MGALERSPLVPLLIYLSVAVGIPAVFGQRAPAFFDHAGWVVGLSGGIAFGLHALRRLLSSRSPKRRRPRR